jgi:hypothetical protein
LNDIRKNAAIYVLAASLLVSSLIFTHKTSSQSVASNPANSKFTAAFETVAVEVANLDKRVQSVESCVQDTTFALTRNDPGPSMSVCP